MNNYVIPTSIVDGFFEYPDEVRKYALSLDYPVSSPEYPGVRTHCLSQINPELFAYILKRFISIFYNEQEKIDWFATARFQKIDGKNTDGWIHKDRNEVISFLVYLNKDISSKAGTSIYFANKEQAADNLDGLKSYNKGEISYKDAIPLLEKNNSQFKKVIEVSNVYNRLVAFDSELWHGQDKLEGNDERLTLIVFIKKLFVNSKPIERMRRGGV